MQIMIDIPQTTYNHVFDNVGISNNDLRNILLGISKSIILPEGHGDLIDRKDLMENSLCKIFGLRSVDIEKAPTIIPADKEE